MFGVPRGPVTGTSSKLVDLIHSDQFSVLLPTNFGFRGDPNVRGTPGCAYGSVINPRSFGRFWPISWSITHRFGLPERFPRLTIPGVRLRVGHQPSQFWPILARFVDYYSLFWGLGVISTTNEHRGALTSRSSTLAVLADSGPFRRLLHTVLGARSDFHD